MQKVYAILRHRKDSGEAIYPEDDVFAAFRLTKLKDVRVVIVGQDPYSTCGLATGLAFSVPDPLPTGQRRRPPSLARIYTAIETDLGKPPRRTGDLGPWACRGVLLLNAVLTVAKDEPGSHEGLGWECFTNRDPARC